MRKEEFFKMLLIEIFVYLGIIAAGVSGVLIGIKKQLDLFGVICLGVTASLGGGIVRDLLIGNIPPVAFIKPSYFFVSLIAGLLAWCFYNKVSTIKNIIIVSDAIGLGVFTAVGSNTVMIYHGNNSFVIIAMGLITGIGGGVLRDIFAKEIPYVFKKEIYAIASILGSVSLILTYDKVPHPLSLYICLFVTFSSRVLSVLLKLNFPVYKVEK